MSRQISEKNEGRGWAGGGEYVKNLGRKCERSVSGETRRKLGKLGDLKSEDETWVKMGKGKRTFVKRK